MVYDPYKAVMVGVSLSRKCQSWCGRIHLVLLSEPAAMSLVQSSLNIKPFSIPGPASPCTPQESLHLAAHYAPRAPAGLVRRVKPCSGDLAFCFFQESQWNELLETLHRLPIPDPGVSVHLSVVSEQGRWTGWREEACHCQQEEVMCSSPSPHTLHSRIL